MSCMLCRARFFRSLFLASGPDVLDTLPMEPQDVDQMVHAAATEAAAVEARTKALNNLITEHDVQTLYDSKPTFLYARTLSLGSVWAEDPSDGEVPSGKESKDNSSAHHDDKDKNAKTCKASLVV